LNDALFPQAQADTLAESAFIGEACVSSKTRGQCTGCKLWCSLHVIRVHPHGSKLVALLFFALF